MDLHKDILDQEAVVVDKKTLFLVLGMHRSGTSAVTRALRTLSIDIGRHTLARRDNPRGFFENPAIVELNTMLLEAMGCQWDSVRTFQASQFRALLASDLFGKASRLLDTLPDGENTGIKDPRISRLLPFWRPLLESRGTATACIIVLRNPSAVAASLAVRDNMPVERAHALWILYTAEAILFSKGLRRILLSYDALMDNPKHEIERLAHIFDLPVLPNELSIFQESFLDQKLRHHTQDDAEGSRAHHLYTTLKPLLTEPHAEDLESPFVERELYAALSGVNEDRKPEERAVLRNVRPR